MSQPDTKRPVNWTITALAGALSLLAGGGGSTLVARAELQAISAKLDGMRDQLTAMGGDTIRLQERLASHGRRIDHLEEELKELKEIKK